MLKKCRVVLDHVLVWQQTLLAGISNLVLFSAKGSKCYGIFQIVFTSSREEDGPASRHRLCDLLCCFCCYSDFAQEHIREKGGGTMGEVIHRAKRRAEREKPGGLRGHAGVVEQPTSEMASRVKDGVKGCMWSSFSRWLDGMDGRLGWGET